MPKPERGCSSEGSAWLCAEGVAVPAPFRHASASPRGHRATGSHRSQDIGLLLHPRISRSPKLHALGSSLSTMTQMLPRMITSNIMPTTEKFS
jgi:hypothetical protein